MFRLAAPEVCNDAEMPMSTMTAEAFDPYGTWLKIHEWRRPLTAYQLLGLPLLEEDPEQIQRAAVQQRELMELHRDEAHSPIWQRVNEELEKAIHVLSNPDLKLAYDMALRVRPDDALQRGRGRLGTPRSLPEGNGLVLCPVCDVENPVARKFCAQCGKSLWQTCAECSTLSAMGEHYCGNCGADLTLAHRRAVQQFETVLEKAQVLHALHRHDDAIKLLAETLSGDGGQAMSDEAIQVKRFLEQLVTDRDLNKAYAERILAESQTLVAEYRFAEAIERLLSIPLAFRTPPLRELIEQTEARQAEIGRLEAELVHSPTRVKPSHLLATVKRILELLPQHTRAMDLANKLGTQLYQLARRKLADHQYTEALHLLDEIPQPVRTEAILKARERVEEVAWLDGELRTTPVIDATLPGIVARLQRLSPHDETVKRAAKEVARRVAEASRSDKFSIPRWAKTPDRSPWGPPVEWLTGFRHISIQDVRHEPAFVDRPGCYYVACGLALQGLSQSQLQTNLRPAENRNMLARMAKIMPRRNARSAWGIDVGSAGIKAVRLIWNHEGRIALHKCQVVEHRRLLSETLDDADWQRCIEESLRTLKAQCDFKGDRICVGLPGMAVLHRMLRLPPLPDDKIEAAVQLEVKQMSTQIRQKLVGAYHVLEKQADQDPSRRGHDVVLLIGRHDRLTSLYDTFQKVGVEVDVMQSDCLALHNYMIYDHLHQAATANPEKTPERAVALLDIGGDLSSLVVSSPRMVWFSSLGMGSDQFTKSLVHELELSHAEAEQTKRHPCKAQRMARWSKALTPVLEDFTHEFNSVMETFSRLHPHVPVDRIVGVGGGFLLHGMLGHLQRGIY